MFSAVILAYFEHEHVRLTQTLGKLTMYGWTLNSGERKYIMSWLINILKSSIGKKYLMAVTGLGFTWFLVIHLAGMMTLYSGQEALVGYGDTLHAFGRITISLVEWSLLLFALTHVGTGLTLFIQNRRARPVRYRVNRSAGGQTFASKIMPYTGLLIFTFLLIHLAHFRFAGTFETTAEMYNVIADSFKHVFALVIYVPAMLVVALHISHGFWSAFQTIGLKHPRRLPVIKGIGLAFSVLVGAGLGFLPIYFFFFS